MIITKKKKENFVAFVVSADQRIKRKESEKKDKYLALARESEKVMEHECDNYTNRYWCFDTVPKGLLKGLKDLKVGGQVETIQTTELLRTARILRRVFET